jgi:hypothetical protein
MFEFLAIWWQPIVLVLIMSFMLWYVSRPETPEEIKARQKRDFDRAHAYAEGVCPVQD